MANLPAQYVNHRSYWSGGHYVLEITGQVRQTRLGGENLLLERRISTALGSNQIEIEDVVINQGSMPQRHMFVYHFNVGFPIVSAASRLRLEVQEKHANFRELDYYALLGIEKGAGPPEVKRAYLQAAKRFKLVDTRSNEAVLDKPVQTTKTHLGVFQVLDFSEVDQPGTYVVQLIVNDG